jgi:hypothetical protein
MGICRLCLNSTCDDEKTVLFDCDHEYHKSCVKLRIRQSDKCFVCDQDFVQDQITTMSLMMILYCNNVPQDIKDFGVRIIAYQMMEEDAQSHSLSVQRIIRLFSHRQEREFILKVNAYIVKHKVRTDLSDSEQNQHRIQLRNDITQAVSRLNKIIATNAAFVRGDQLNDLMRSVSRRDPRKLEQHVSRRFR